MWLCLMTFRKKKPIVYYSAAYNLKKHKMQKKNDL